MAAGTAGRSIDGFDAVEFLEYLRAHRRFVLICCGSAVLLALVVSLLLPRRYTATASILIRPPAGMDPRAAGNVNSVYLESLKTFEHVAASDSLFLRSLEHLGIRQQFAGRTIESLKRSVLQISKPVNTRVIEISATLEDPRKAQALAQYIAEQTVELSRSLDTQFSGDVASEGVSIFAKAEARLQAATAAAERAAKTPAPASLSAELDNARELKLRVDEEVGKEHANLAELTARNPGESAITFVQARIADLEKQERRLAQTLSSTGAQLEMLKQRHGAVDAELEAARTDFESASTKLSDIRAEASARGERLDVFDPGIVPQRPSSPNVSLNVLAALLFALMASMAFMVFRFGYERARRSVTGRAWSPR